MSKKKHILKLDTKDEYLALGLVSSESEFQLSLLLNSFLSIKLALVSPLVKILKSNRMSFSCFKFDNEGCLQATFVKNKSKGVFLFQNQQSFDYIIFLSGSEASINADLILKEFKNLSNISIISTINIAKLGNFRRIIL